MTEAEWLEEAEEKLASIKALIQLTTPSVHPDKLHLIDQRELDQLRRRAVWLMQQAPSSSMGYRFGKVPLIAALLQQRGVANPSARATMARLAEQFCAEPRNDTQDVLEVSRIWGACARNVGAWPEAIRAYTLADLAIHRLARAKTGHDRVVFLANQGGRILVDFAYCLCHDGKRSEAAIALERGQSLLVQPAEDSKRLGALEEDGYTSEVKNYQSAIKAVRQLRQLKTQTASQTEWEDLNHRERTAQADCNAALEVLRGIPGYSQLGLEVQWKEVLCAAQNANLMYLFEATNGIVAIFVDGDGVRAAVEARLPPETVTRLALAWRMAILSDRVQDQPRALDELLSAVAPLVRQVLPLIENEARLRVIAAGTLRHVPLHAVSVGNGERLVDRILVTYAHSARHFCNSLERARHIESRHYIGFGDPQPLPPNYPRLRGARAEVVAAAKCFRNRRVHVGHKATAPRVVEALKEANILHIAAHGDLVNGDFTVGIVMANGQSFDLSRGYGRVLPTRLGVVSCCWGAAANPSLRDQTVSLPAQLLEAGACAVIASDRPLDDDVSAFVVARFFSIWMRETDDPAIALQRAQRWLMRADLDELRRMRRQLFWPLARWPRLPDSPATPPPFAHPTAWAPLFLFGA